MALWKPDSSPTACPASINLDIRQLIHLETVIFWNLGVALDVSEIPLAQPGCYPDSREQQAAQGSREFRADHLPSVEHA
jgi:hypothetical protein